MAAALVVGLGNPTDAYHFTRHNLGFETLDALVKLEEAIKKEYAGKVAWKKARYADALEYRTANGQILLKPQTYMNRSGSAVKEALNWWKLSISDILVVVDDVALPLGRMRLRESGSSGGHNGLHSIEQALGSQYYPRLRLGIGLQKKDSDQNANANILPLSKKEACFSSEASVFTHSLADFVLGRWTQHEIKLVERIKQEAIKIIQLCASDGLEIARTQASRLEL